MVSMEFIKENIQLSHKFPFRIFQTEAKKKATPEILHSHDCLEINYVLDGEGVYIIGDSHYTIERSDIIIINNEEHHYAFSQRGVCLLVIIFDPELIWQTNTFDYGYLKSFFQRNKNYSHCISKQQPLSTQLYDIMKEIIREDQMRGHHYQWIIKANLMKLLAVVNRYFLENNQISDINHKEQRAFDRIKESVMYINAHYTQTLSLDEVARLAAMNSTYFSDYFKRVMKKTLTEYILSLRMNHAKGLLKQTNESVTDISMESGFGNVSYFNRVFKKRTGLSPIQYRKSLSL